MGDLEVALAFVARRSGRPAMPVSDWVHQISLGLGWMAPGQARSFVARALAAGLLSEVDGLARLTFLPGDVEVPLGFRPDPEAAAPAPAAVVDPFAVWLQRVAERTQSTKASVLSQVAERQARLGGLLTAWAALLWLAAESGLDVKEAAGLRG